MVLFRGAMSPLIPVSPLAISVRDRVRAGNPIDLDGVQLRQTGQNGAVCLFEVSGEHGLVHRRTEQDENLVHGAGRDRPTGLRRAGHRYLCP